MDTGTQFVWYLPLMKGTEVTQYCTYVHTLIDRKLGSYTFMYIDNFIPMYIVNVVQQNTKVGRASTFFYQNKEKRVEMSVDFVHVHACICMRNETGKMIFSQYKNIYVFLENCGRVDILVNQSSKHQTYNNFNEWLDAHFYVCANMKQKNPFCSKSLIDQF